MTRRWVCPLCGAGKLAPSRPRADDVRRYCLPCSGKTGRLVNCTCPAADAVRVQRRAKHTEKRLRARAKEAQRLATYPWSLYAAAKKYARLKSWERDLTFAVTDKLTIRKGSHPSSSGHAYPASGYITVTAGTDPADGLHTLLHEMAHVAAGPRQGHNTRFYSILHTAIGEVVGRPVVAKNKRKDYTEALRGVAMTLGGSCGCYVTEWNEEHKELRCVSCRQPVLK
jgi:hypothetical protein